MAVDEHRNFMKRRNEERVQQSGPTFKKKRTKTQTEERETVCSQEQFEKNIVEYFIHSMISFRTIEDPYFLKIFTDLDISNTGLKLISRRTLIRRIDNYYENQINQIKSELEEVPYVCTTIDIWSGKKRSFLGVTAHWIKKDLKRKSVALVCQRFKGTHSFDHISELILGINRDFGLTTQKLVASVTDNGSNFVKAFRVFGVQPENICFSGNSNSVTRLNESDSEDEEKLQSEMMNLLPIHLRCCAHTLSLCATSDANKVLGAEGTILSDMHKSVIKKCNALWNTANRPKTAEIIQEILHHTLSRPGETRWNSLYDALQQISSIQEKSLQ